MMLLSMSIVRLAGCAQFLDAQLVVIFSLLNKAASPLLVSSRLDCVLLNERMLAKLCFLGFRHTQAADSTESSSQTPEALGSAIYAGLLVESSKLSC